MDKKSVRMLPRTVNDGKKKILSRNVEKPKQLQK